MATLMANIPSWCLTFSVLRPLLLHALLFLMTLYTQTPAREDLFLPGQGSDLLLKTANGALHVHRLLLRLASPVFSALLEATPKDGRREHVTVSEDTETVIALLAMLYPNMKRTPFPTLYHDYNQYNVQDPNLRV